MCCCLSAYQGGPVSNYQLYTDKFNTKSVGCSVVVFFIDGETGGPDNKRTPKKSASTKYDLKKCNGCRY